MRREHLIRWGDAPMVAGVLAILAYGIWVAVGEPAGSLGVMNWLYNGSLMMAGVACLTKALTRSAPRGPFIAFGLGLLFWTAGDIYYTEVLEHLRRIPYPSWADAGYLAALPCFFVGIGLLIRRRIGRFTVASWFDGAIGALAAAALATSLLSPALVGLTKGDPATVLTNLSYPLGDLLLIAFVSGALVVSGVRGAQALLAVGAGLLLWGTGDAVYLYQAATNTYDGGFIDVMWPIGALTIALGAQLSTASPPEQKAVYRSSIALPVGFGLIAAAILAWDHYDKLHSASVWLAEATVCAVLIRLVSSVRENNRLMAELHSDSVTDMLTGLGNRRALSRDLAGVGERSRAGGDVFLFALFDLDGFKFYNDSFGHPAGDLVLERLGSNLSRAVGEDCSYRLGGDEFCILEPLNGRDAAALADVARAALTEKGEGFSVGASCGWAVLPEEAATASAALRLVDTRMYAEKAMRSVRNAHQMQEIFRRIFQQHDPELNEHFEGVTRLAVEVGRELGLDAEELDAVARAAELHDIGKIAIPQDILHKPGPLDEGEWELMRRHTVIGDRILSATPAMKPVARLVRWSHERWDGSGYPDGLAGDQIPVGSRLISICDSFDAMTSERAYQAARSPEEAIAELRACAGTQFDPDLVDLFCSVLERGPRPVLTGERRYGP